MKLKLKRNKIFISYNSTPQPAKNISNRSKSKYLNTY